MKHIQWILFILFSAVLYSNAIPMGPIETPQVTVDGQVIDSNTVVKANSAVDSNYVAAVVLDLINNTLSISNWDAAFSWGDHSTNRYVTSDGNETITGDWYFSSTGTVVTVLRRAVVTAATTDYTVTGTLIPDATGAYTENGTYGGYAAYEHSSGSYWIYLWVAGDRYCIYSSVGTDTPYFQKSSDLLTVAGTYTDVEGTGTATVTVSPPTTNYYDVALSTPADTTRWDNAVQPSYTGNVTIVGTNTATQFVGPLDGTATNATALHGNTNTPLYSETVYMAGTNLDLVGTEFNLDAAAQASDDLADSSVQTETDPIWGAVSNTVTTGAALGATSAQPDSANDFTGANYFSTTTTVTTVRRAVVTTEYTVTGTLTPDATGVYTENGVYSGLPQYEIAGGAYWMFSAGDGFWRINTNANLNVPLWYSDSVAETPASLPWNAQEGSGIPTVAASALVTNYFDVALSTPSDTQRWDNAVQPSYTGNVSIDGDLAVSNVVASGSISAAGAVSGGSVDVTGTGTFGGDVGVGFTTAPDSEFEVRGSDSSTRIIIRSDNATANGGVMIQDGTVFKGGFLYTETGGALSFYGPAGGSGVINMFSSGDIAFSDGSTGTKWARFSDGSLGIGTNAPATTLDVNGAATIRGDLDMNANAITNVADGVAATDAATVGQLVDTFQGARQDIGTGTNLVWLPTRYSGKWTTTNSATFAMSTSDYPRSTYSLWQYGAHAITFDANIDVQNGITPSGTNLWVIGPADSTTNWVAVGRSF